MVENVISKREEDYISSVQRRCWYESEKAGWHVDTDHYLYVPAKLALISSEISEALEADRKNLTDDKIPSREGVEVELADAVIRIFDLAETMGLDIAGAMNDKMMYNRVRVDHKQEVRKGVHGKAY